MRFWMVCASCVCLWTSRGYSQIPEFRTDTFIPQMRTDVFIPQMYSTYGSHSRGRHFHGPALAPGYGYHGYSGLSYGVGCYNQFPFGIGHSSYSSVYYGVPGFSVGYSAPLFGNYGFGGGYGYSGWGAPIYSAPPIFVNPQPAMPELPQWMLDEAHVDNNRGEQIKPISQTHRSLIQPSTPEALLRSVRLQAAGDRLFANLDYLAAGKTYAKSVQAAPDRPEPYVRLAMAKAARGDFRTAVAFLKQMTDVDPKYPSRADSLDQLFGPQNGISKLQLKQRVADWTKVDVRDTDRIFLLGIVLFLDGDERFRTLLDTALKLDGEQLYLRAFLDAEPARDKTAPAPTPDEIDALSPQAPAQPPQLGPPRGPLLPGNPPAQSPLLLPKFPALPVP